VAGPHFRLEHVAGGGAVEALGEAERWALPLSGTATAGGEIAGPGECLLVPAGAALEGSDGGALLVAAV
jgi:hypothetical protein